MEKFADNLEKLWNNVKSTLKKGKEWAVKNPKITIAGVVVIALFIVVIVVLDVSKRNEKAASLEANATQTDLEKQSASALQVPELALEENAHEDVNQFIAAYYNALAEGNIDAIVSMRNYTDDTEKIKIAKKSEYIESHQNLVCYTKPGPMENSYIVYAYYEVKFVGIETLAPSLNSLYVYKEGEEYQIGSGDMDSNIAEYLKQASAQDDVVDLFNRVDVKYNEAVEADEQLRNFLTELPAKLKTEVGEELAKAEAAATVSAPSIEEETEAPTEEAPSETEEAEMVTVETIKTTTTVNVRSSDSETADKVGKASEGSTYTRLEERPNGWSKIEFEGKEAYVKSEFVEVVDTTTVEVNDTADTNDTSADVGEAAEGKIIIKETVNVRKSASESGERLGVAYKGDQYELIMKQADGWTKIKYKGNTAYIKSEFVE